MAGLCENIQMFKLLITYWSKYVYNDLQLASGLHTWEFIWKIQTQLIQHLGNYSIAKKNNTAIIYADSV